MSTKDGTQGDVSPCNSSRASPLRIQPYRQGVPGQANYVAMIMATQRKDKLHIHVFPNLLNSPFFDYVEMLQVEVLFQEPRLAYLKALHADALVAT